MSEPFLFAKEVADGLESRQRNGARGGNLQTASASMKQITRETTGKWKRALQARKEAHPERGVALDVVRSGKYVNRPYSAHTCCATTPANVARKPKGRCAEHVRKSDCDTTIGELPAHWFASRSSPRPWGAWPALPLRLLQQE